jgi:hypothetical protein
MVDPDSGDIFLFGRAGGLLHRWNHSTGWGDPVQMKGQAGGQILFDPHQRRFLSWDGFRGAIRAAPATGGRWQLLSEGTHDVSGGGMAGFNHHRGVPFQFGGYGYFTCKNWVWELDPDALRWDMVVPNRPGVDPCPRSTQVFPGRGPAKVLFFSGGGNDTGIQREHRPRGGLPIATDVGYWTWLRDLWQLDFADRKWECLLSPNHSSIRREGRYGFNRQSGFHLLWGGLVPPGAPGASGCPQEGLSIWDGVSPSGFRPVRSAGPVPQFRQDSTWIDVQASTAMMLVQDQEAWLCVIEPTLDSARNSLPHPA